MDNSEIEGILDMLNSQIESNDSTTALQSLVLERQRDISHLIQLKKFEIKPITAIRSAGYLANIYRQSNNIFDRISEFFTVIEEQATASQDSKLIDFKRVYDLDVDETQYKSQLKFILTIQSGILELNPLTAKILWGNAIGLLSMEVDNLYSIFGLQYLQEGQPTADFLDEI
jgi:hypothetical protein